MSDPAQQPAPGAPEGGAPGGPPPGQSSNTSSNRRMQQAQAEVAEVVGVMRVNVDKVLERDVILSKLDDRADALRAGASVFESNAAELRRKYWWKNFKMMIMMGVICAVVVLVIVRSWLQVVTSSSVISFPRRELPHFLGKCVFLQNIEVPTLR
nr:vesicle-associated membrane protein 1 isoform X2 [Dromaius novaehollandiae]